METKRRENTEVILENERLRSSLAEAEDLINAIRTGGIDAIVVSSPEGEKIYTLTGAESPYRTMVESMGEGAVTLSSTGAILYSNSSFARIIQSPLQKIIGSMFIEYLDPESKIRFDNILKGKRKKSKLELFLLTNNSRIPVYLSINPLKDGNSDLLTVVITDLTHQKNEELMRKHNLELKAEIAERNKAELALRKSEERFRSIFESNVAALAIWESHGSLLDANDRFLQLLGYTREEFESGHVRWDEATPAELRQRDYDAVKELQAGKVIEPYEKEFIRLDGTRVPVIVGGNILPGAADIGVIFAIDITERKLAKDDLKNSLRLGSALNTISTALFSNLKVGERMKILVGEGAKALECESVGISLLKDGVWTVSYVYGFPGSFVGATMTNDEQPHAVLALRTGEPVVIQDAYNDERVNTEHMRKHKIRSVLVMPLIVQDEPIGVILLNHQTAPIPFSDSQIDFARQLAVTAALALQNSYLVEELGKTISTLDTKVQERTAQLLEMNNSLLDEVDERKRTEKALRLAQKDLRSMESEVVLTEEKSRNLFAIDLHDTVVQTLGAAKLRSQLIQDKITTEAKPIFNEMQNLLTESIKQARSIMAEMSPPVLNELGLIPSLEWLSEKVMNEHQIDISFVNKTKRIKLPRDIQVLLFQSVRELLLNVAKHAQARIVTVKVTQNGRNMNIEITDDGKGFDVKTIFIPGEQGGFGLYGIRERLKHIGGKLAIKSGRNQGTTVLMLVPLGEKEE